MVLSKLDLAIVAVIACGMLWIEHEHRIVIATPAVAEVSPTAASVCPDRDDVPFSAACIAFISGNVVPDRHSRVSAAASTSAASPDAPGRFGSSVSACPASNEEAPYSAACIKFLSGWYWQPNPTENAP